MPIGQPTRKRAHVVIALFVFAFAAGPTLAATETIRVQFQDVASIYRDLTTRREGGHAFPSGIDRIVADNRMNSLVVTGTDEAVAAVKKRVKEIDVPIAAFSVAIEVTRVNGDESPRLVAKTTRTSLDGHPMSIQVASNASGFRIEASPYVRADGSVRLVGAIHQLGGGASIHASVHFEQTLKRGEGSFTLKLHRWPRNTFPNDPPTGHDPLRGIADYHARITVTRQPNGG